MSLTFGCPCPITLQSSGLSGYTFIDSIYIPDLFPPAVVWDEDPAPRLERGEEFLEKTQLVRDVQDRISTKYQYK